MLYIEIHRLHKEGFSKSAIAGKLNISRNRVIDYLNMTADEFEDFLSTLQSKRKITPTCFFVGVYYMLYLVLFGTRHSSGIVFDQGRS